MSEIEYSRAYLEGYELGKQIKLSNKSIHYLSNITKLKYKINDNESAKKFEKGLHDGYYK